MKIQWVGYGHKSKAPLYHYDHYGLSNFHRLKYRTTTENATSRGESKSIPFLAIMCSGNPKKSEPSFAAKSIVREFINNFRHLGRSELLDTEKLQPWMEFQLADARSKLKSIGEEDTMFIGCESSVTAVIIDGKKAVIGQFGTDTFLYHQRKKDLLYSTIKSSEPALIPDDRVKSTSYDGEGNGNSQTKEEGIHADFLSVDLKKNDLLLLGTKGLSSVINPNVFFEITKRPRTSGDMDTAVAKMTTRASLLTTEDSIGALLLKIR